MNIKSRLQIIVVISVALALFTGLVLGLTMVRTTAALEKNQLMHDIVREVSEQRVLAGEYLQRRNDRPKEQWRNKEISINQLLSKLPRPINTEEAFLYGRLRQTQINVRNLFNQLVGRLEAPADNLTPAAAASAQDVQFRLQDQLIAQSQTMITDSLRVTSLSRQEVLSTQSRAAIVLAVLITLSVLFIIAAVVWLGRTILLSLRKLSAGTAIIGSGQLDYRIKLKTHDELGALAKDFNAMAGKLQQLDRAKSEFVTVASHQLRTPLTVLRWLSSALLSEDSKNLNSKQKKYAQQIYDNNQKLIDLVNALLTVGGIELGTLPMRLQPVDPAAVIERALSSVSGKIAKKKLTVSTNYATQTPEIIADPQLLQVVIENLLTNAIAYSPYGKTINLHVKNETKYVVFEVHDEGQGINEAQKDQVFTKFYRGETARDHAPDGSGLGLYIVKGLVEMMGGKIWFDSSAQAGTTIYVQLPVKRNSDN